MWRTKKPSPVNLYLAHSAGQRNFKKTVPGKAVVEAKKQNRLSALGSPCPDGGQGAGGMGE